MARRGKRLDAFTFGGRLPWGVGLLLVVTLALSLFAAFGSRHGAPLTDACALAPADVWGGEVWRLVTWPWMEPGPLGLIFACLFLVWFGRDLAEEQGSPGFLAVFGGVLLAAGVCTCLVAQVDPAVLGQRYLGGWALADAMIVAWGLWFPHRVVRLYFVLPIRGFWMAWLTVAITVVLAIYMGWEGFLPELCAEGAILAWIYRGAFVSGWSRLRRGAAEARRRGDRARQRTAARAKSAAHLRLVESNDADPPPLPPDVQSRIDELLGGGKRGED